MSKKIIIGIVSAIILCIGMYHIGYRAAIKNAILVETSDTGYAIGFNGQIHDYTWEENK